mmetsp:Transcript_34859/g.48348  ORF Transcript_34859/g.48348 Transcript_34859/m.48348 type:complete len:341 (-) Transcript_34859:99-1121(-)
MVESPSWNLNLPRTSLEGEEQDEGNGVPVWEGHAPMQAWMAGGTDGEEGREGENEQEVPKLGEGKSKKEGEEAGQSSRSQGKGACKEEFVTFQKAAGAKSPEELTLRVRNLEMQQRQMMDMMEGFMNTVNSSINELSDRVQHLESAVRIPPLKCPPASPSPAVLPDSFQSHPLTIPPDLGTTGVTTEYATPGGSEVSEGNSGGLVSPEEPSSPEAGGSLFERQYSAALLAGDELEMMAALNRTGPVALELRPKTLKSVLRFLLSLLQAHMCVALALPWLEQLLEIKERNISHRLETEVLSTLHALSVSSIDLGINSKALALFNALTSHWDILLPVSKVTC